MTLPDEDVIAFLQSSFVLCHRNIEKDQHVGMSHGYSASQSAVGTTNGAGARNVQFLVLAPDEQRTVLHALPGFWHGEDLIHELKLGLEIHRLHGDASIDPAARHRMFRMLHGSHLRRHGKAAESRGQWQGFDRWAELQRVQKDPGRDTFKRVANGELALKSIPEIVHDRMVARPFQPLAVFDVESFVDYGRAFYDNNQGIDRGRKFRKAERVNRERAEQKAKAEALARRADDRMKGWKQRK